MRLILPHSALIDYNIITHWLTVRQLTEMSPASVPDTHMRNAVTQLAEQEKGFYGTRALRQ